MDPSETLATCDLFFVYGTLKQGYGNNRLLSSSTCLGPAVTADSYILGDIGFPYAFPQDEVSSFFKEEMFHPVLGELYQVHDEHTVANLDSLEGEGVHYHRKLVDTTTGDQCWMYLQYDIRRLEMCYQCDLTEEGEWVWNR